jgi:tetratricopeptide (TPR) repeat protein
MHATALQLVSIGQTEQAIAIYDTLLSHDPNNIHLMYNKAYTLKLAHQIDQAIVIYKNIIAYSPEYEQAKFGLAMSYLLKGDFDNAWPYYMHHVNKTNPHSLQLLTFLNTHSIAGKKIILHYQGGLGDSIHFIRYAQILKELGATIIVQIQKELVQLFSACPYIDTIITTVPKDNAYDAYVSIMALPALFKSNEKTIPRNIPYLFPDTTLISLWKRKIKKDNTIKIGICWQASIQNDSSRYPVARRGIPLALFSHISRIKGITLYSLQRYDGQTDLQNIPSGMSIIFFDDLDTTNGPFMDTAALMKNLDVVISVDTAIAHLAGALGVPVYLLLPYSSDWRWIEKREDSPWYPSMHILQQLQPFDWITVINKLTEHISLRYSLT